MSQAFIVSARKYRPVRFSDVVGQQHVAGTLRNALATDRLAHAFLFCGPRGVGKTTCARILAKILNCTNRTPAFEACGECPSCRSFTENASFNIIELDAASNNSVEHIRALVEQVRFQPQQGRYKIFIIDEVHMLSNAAFNAFLKTLEEPPPYAIFILATTERHKIIPTILSRCQIFDFRRISIADMVEHLKNICGQEGIEFEEDALHIIAQKADGALRDALSIFDRITSFSGKKITYADVIDNLNVLDYDYYFQLTDSLVAEDLVGVLELFDQIQRKGFEPDIFINGLAEHLRNILVCKDEATLKLLEVGDKLRERYRRQAAIAPNSFLLSCLSLANDCDINFKMARHKRLHVEMTLIKMTYIGRAVEAAKSGAGFAIPEKKTPDGSITGSESPKMANLGGGNPQNALPFAQPSPETYPEKQTQAASASVAEPNFPNQEKPNLSSSLPGTPRKLGLGNKTTSLRLDAFEAAVVAETAYQAGQKSLFNLENAQIAWKKYTETVDAPTLRQSLQNSELRLEGEMLCAKIGLSFQKTLLQEESGRLLDFLRKELNDISIKLRVEVDEAQAEALKIANLPKKVLTKTERLEQMAQTHPMVGELMRRFELKLED